MNKYPLTMATILVEIQHNGYSDRCILYIMLAIAALGRIPLLPFAFLVRVKKAGNCQGLDASALRSSLDDSLLF